jgi:hypothetical protein
MLQSLNGLGMQADSGVVLVSGYGVEGNSQLAGSGPGRAFGVSGGATL